MNANLTPGVDTGKIFNVKNLLTTLILVVIVVWVLQKIGKQTLIMYGSDGKETGRGEIKYIMKAPIKKA
ncbi:MAG: hypothetical protein NTX61_08225 [Bacteroidetes bacterium]|nr:hypothetical protein [Bacteroidota bacterium]